MLGKHVSTDLELTSITVPTQLSWGTDTFHDRLQSPIHDINELKRRQLALFALRHPDAHDIVKTVTAKLNSLQPTTAIVDEFAKTVDPRIAETIDQIFWPPSSFGAFLNDKPHIISAIVFWKARILPTIAVLIPLLAIVIPFFLIRFYHGIELEPAAYMAQLKEILLKQVTIPPILRAKHDADIMGHMLESGFLVLTAATYISGIWSQVTASLHLHAIATGLRDKGAQVCHLLTTHAEILTILHELPARLRKALHPFLLRGEKALAEAADIPRDGGYRTYGYIWTQGRGVGDIKTWLGELDAMLGIVGISDITFPEYKGSLLARGLYHPTLTTRTSNTVIWSPATTHAILTGPNRGGKSTMCRAIGVSILCAQTWGFAFAEQMAFTPFTAIETALHPADTLGEMSLFEAEIEFAKDVLARGNQPGERMFVMMDEIFHSTNAVDGLAASRVFLRQLFGLPNVTSLISTHYKELPAEFGNEALAWAMDATEGADGLLQYSYRLVAGISDKSSVMEILRERGLIAG